MSLYQDIANYLVSAEEDRREVPKVTVNMKPDLSVEEAYFVQQEIVNRKLMKEEELLVLRWA